MDMLPSDVSRRAPQTQHMQQTLSSLIRFETLLQQRIAQVLPMDIVQMQVDAKDKKRKKTTSHLDEEESIAKTIQSMKAHILAVKALEDH